MQTQEQETSAPHVAQVCTKCLGHVWNDLHKDNQPCVGGEFKAHTFADQADHVAQYEKREIERLEKRAETAVSTLRNVNERHDAEQRNAGNNYGNSAATCATLRAMMHTAWLLGGESLRSFVVCVETLVRFKAVLHSDSAMLSLCWSGAGMHGGFIFHTSDRTWMIHD